MADDFYPFVDSGDPAPDNSHITGAPGQPASTGSDSDVRRAAFATRISIYDDMLSTPRVVVVEPGDVRSYLEEVTNTVYRCMREQGGSISLMVIRELVENFIHADFAEPVVSILDKGNTIRFADQGPGIADKERAFEFGITSATRDMKRYIRGTGAGFPMVQQYLEAAGGAVSIEDNLGAGTVVTVTVDPARVSEVERHGGRGAAVRADGYTTDGPRVPPSHGMSQVKASDGGAGAGVPAGQTNHPGQPAQSTDPLYPRPSQPAAGAPYPQPYPQGWPWGWNAGGAQAPYGIPYGTPGAPAVGVYPDPAGAYPPAPYGSDPYRQPIYPQSGHEFSTPPGYPYPPAAPAAAPVDAGGAAGMGGGTPYVSERARQALAFMHEHGQVGPTDLERALGLSASTWSRELATLNKQGFAAKQGQKYHLTDLGIAWIETR